MELLSVLLVEYCPPARCHLKNKVGTIPMKSISWRIVYKRSKGTCSLESLGKRGYRIPKQGTIQATLFNPQGTVVKVFVVTYDMSDMPPSSQTFIRQRTFVGTDEDSKAEKHLVNLIHFRLNNTLDALNLELNGRVGQDSARYRLIVETELPRHPRYSPKK
ncbi:hypothetical protein TELCIR_08572 [Teladorsagia circumcincta]|uniref:Uncharacterized protein n=1 Tax=Teladorsagia circumcincta TaxID=45464 RepID=A0A2G9UH66_TELCI|nr:hypothetical protein TELCIR_08572 [Teladorsagia circumcincta]